MAARSPDGKPIDQGENRRRMENGELYWAFTPDLVAQRRKAIAACRHFNNAADPSRRQIVELFKDIVCDTTALPPQSQDEDEDEVLLEDYPWVDQPIKTDYGYNVKLGKNVYVNSYSVWIDTCPIYIGDRTLIGPNCSFYSGTHPVDYHVRNGTRGPESGAPIHVGEDCWFGGNVIVLPGVTIGRGAVIGAGSVVTKDVPSCVVVAGNPARVLRRIETTDPGAGAGTGEGAIGAAASAGGVEVLEGEDMPKVS
ncbi:Fc.00g084440.m01.CDS01 [Cosmosporella sp. VM-42]